MKQSAEVAQPRFEVPPGQWFAPSGVQIMFTCRTNVLPQDHISLHQFPFRRGMLAGACNDGPVWTTQEAAGRDAGGATRQEDPPRGGGEKIAPPRIQQQEYRLPQSNALLAAAVSAPVRVNQAVIVVSSTRRKNRVHLLNKFVSSG
jgi:hypothetical protein